MCIVEVSEVFELLCCCPGVPTRGSSLSSTTMWAAALSLDDEDLPDGSKLDACDDDGTLGRSTRPGSTTASRKKEPPLEHQTKVVVIRLCCISSMLKA